MNLACLMPTYGRPALVRSSIACFLAQDHPADQRRLLILDDAGQIEPQQGEGWTIWSTAIRTETLAAKYVELARLDAGWADAFIIWDDDDIYLPWHLSTHAAALRDAQWSHPLEVWSLYTGRLELEPTQQRFWATAAVRRELLARSGGFAQSAVLRFDQLNLQAWRQHGGEPGRPAPPAFVLGWRRSNHCSALDAGPQDTSWYGRHRMMQTARVGRIDPAMDAGTKAVYRVLVESFRSGDEEVEMTQVERIPTHQPGVHFEEMAGESLLFNEATKKTIYLNEAASAIWKLCDGTRSVAALIDLLQQAYADPEHDFAADVHDTLDGFFAEGVLRWVEGGESRVQPQA